MSFRPQVKSLMRVMLGCVKSFVGLIIPLLLLIQPCEAIEMLTSTRNSNEINEAATIRICLPYKGQRAAGAARKQMRDLSNKIGLSIKPVLIGNLFKFGRIYCTTQHLNHNKQYNPQM